MNKEESNYTRFRHNPSQRGMVGMYVRVNEHSSMNNTGRIVWVRGAATINLLQTCFPKSGEGDCLPQHPAFYTAYGFRHSASYQEHYVQQIDKDTIM